MPKTNLLDPKNKELAKLSRKVWKSRKPSETGSSASRASLTEKLKAGVKVNAELDRLRKQAFSYDPTVEEVLDRHFRHGDENACKMEILRAQLFGQAEEGVARQKWYATTLQQNPRQIVIDRFGKSDMRDFPKEFYKSLKEHFQFGERINTGLSDIWQSSDDMLKVAWKISGEVPLRRRFGDNRMTQGFLEFRQKADSFRLLFEKSAYVLRTVEDTQFYDTNRPNFGWNVAKDIWEDHVALVNLCGEALQSLHPRLGGNAEQAGQADKIPKARFSVDVNNVPSV